MAATSGTTAYSTQTFAFTNPVVGSHRLYLVFKPLTGGAASAFGNLSWVEFTGDGIDLPTDTPPATTASFALLQSACSGSCVGISEAPVVTLTATDDVQVASTEYRVDGGAWTPYSAPFKLTLAYGLHALEYRSTDVDGNLENAGTTSVLLNPSEHGAAGGTVPATRTHAVAAGPRGPAAASNMVACAT